MNGASKTGQGIIVLSEGTENPEAQRIHSQFFSIEPVSGGAHLIGRKVALPVGKQKAQGKIVALHGKNGLVRTRFKKGVPGQAFGSLVEIIG